MPTNQNKRTIYRILDFSRAVEIFTKKELYFAHPSAWDDPYEKRFQHSNSHALFASCWCQSAISDAMWRIYSPNGLGARISVTKTSLEESVKSWIKNQKKGYKWRGKEIKYLDRDKLNNEIRSIESDLNKDYNISRAVDALYLKREAFSHEDEWRSLIYCPDSAKERKGISVPIDPHSLINGILLDPRAPDALIDAFQFFFKNKLGFKKSIRRSVLYKTPAPIVIDDEDS